MSLHDTVRAFSEDSIAKVFSHNTWLQNFVSQKVSSAFQMTLKVFSEEAFFERLTSHTLTKILARNVVNLYSKKVLDLKENNQADGNSLLLGSPSPTSHWSNWVNPTVPRMPSEGSKFKIRDRPESVEKVEVLAHSSTARDSQTFDDAKLSTFEAVTSKSKAPSSREIDDSQKAAEQSKIADHAENASDLEAAVSTLAHIFPVAVALEGIDTEVLANESVCCLLSTALAGCHVLCAMENYTND